MTKKYQIEIPETALDQTDFHPGDHLALSVNHKQIDVRPARVIDQLPQIAFWWYALPAAVVTLVFYAFFRERNAVRPIPLTGSDYSLANGAMLLGVISGLVIFITTFIVEKVRKTGPTKDFYWRSLPRWRLPVD